MSENTSPPTRPRNYGWVYFYVFVIVASVSVAGFMIWFNLSIQLTPEKLADAKKLWQQKGPKSYDMTYTKRLNDDATVSRFDVKVRSGVLEEVKLNGQKLVKQPDQESDPRIYHSMDRLLSDIERFMNIDNKPGAPKVYVTAIFEPDNGALRRYIRRVMGTTQRIELHVTLSPADK